MKDYYKILELSADASEEQIRKAYRRLALKYHPDHNQGDPLAEERFKEMAEAYGVLIDPAKRTQYNQWRNSGAHERMAGRGFRYSQEEIFQDLFRNPSFSHVFQDLFKEFERTGVRFDQRFFDQVFFGGRGILFGGIFVLRPFGSTRMRVRRPQQQESIPRSDTPQIQPFGFLKRLGQKLGHYLLGDQKALPGGAQEVSDSPQDLAYDLTLPTDEAERGTWVTIAIDRDSGRETLKVKIPPETQPGTRLRLAGKGIRQGQRSGDLYLTVHLS
jgi:DnaJ-class molecular chaperone